MIPYANSSNAVLILGTSGGLGTESLSEYNSLYGSVRQVINLYKSAIE